MCSSAVLLRLHLPSFRGESLTLLETRKGGKVTPREGDTQTSDSRVKLGRMKSGAESSHAANFARTEPRKMCSLPSCMEIGIHRCSLSLPLSSSSVQCHFLTESPSSLGFL
ncbi:hypothetical protein GOP47_0022307 [Adiantum capillus-veneris]|uniref:Uncharacterized protein n=1 Tax=Adiantum capillus-veneris TaxID=13818 RepID=A0A9D4Z7F3_ADICA|nr:hypothetical protein GOP47_0022307 [Adiantum capillus-veneris]